MHRDRKRVEPDDRDTSCACSHELQASCPPSSWYTSAHVAALEQRSVFRPTWQVLALHGGMSPSCRLAADAACVGTRKDIH